MRAYNERLVLSLVRRHGGLAKADITRNSGLSAQTVSVIMRELERDGLLLRGEPIKGKVGQPSVPMHLAPDGALSFGLKIGRRSADLALMNFVGEVTHQLSQVYPYPLPRPILDFAAHGIDQFVKSLSKENQGRIAGLGIATPFELWNWSDDIGAPRQEMAVWRETDVAEELAGRCKLPVFSQNDATAACGAELIFGRGVDQGTFLYVFIGSFIGGGIVLNHSLYAGQSGNAGALGSMPLLAADGSPRQLIDEASIVVLENQLRALGMDPSRLWRGGEGWSGFDELLEQWIGHTARNLANAIVASCSVIDFPLAIIDGAFPAGVRRAIVEATRRAISDLDLQGIQRPDLVEGMVGPKARVIGAAALPFFARYLVDQDVLFKSSA